MNNMSTNSECTSGCESGWTMYLDQSGDEERHHKGGGGGGKRPDVSVLQEQDEDLEDDDDDDNNDDEDLSMVSDASSGPRQLQVHDDEEEDNSSMQQRMRIKQTKQTTKTRLNQHKTSSYLDDTASSPAFTLSKSKKDEGSMEHDMGLSKESKGKSRYQKHFGSLKKPSSAPEKSICFR